MRNIPSEHLLEIGADLIKVKVLEHRIEELKAKKELVYLAGPYSSHSASEMHNRFEALNRIASNLMKDGHLIFSPISHTHPIAMAGNLPTGWDFWEKYDSVMLSCCKKLIVAKLDGWKESRGVQAEIKIAQKLGLEIEYLEDK
jgi:hypothetical protein